MIWSTLFLRIMFILIFFPGIFYLIYDKIFIVRRGTTDKFVFALISSVLLSLIFVREMSIIIVLLLSVIIPAVQAMLELHSAKRFLKAFREKKFLLQTLIFIPFLEEYIFRYVMYETFASHGVPHLFYIGFSALVFTFMHYYKLKTDSFYKMALGIMLASVFAYTTNLFAVILMHIIFNVVVYLIKYTNNYRGFQT
ncbi:CPBP family intramembrane glutamic endopeptidase [Virgibacillus alimentarius]|uniref:CPBP family intramembrane glutamic endopeptidase n=1 Tax=Virgibacillus alimentarius TaxID=698769 RepID=UPI0004936103